MKQLSLSLVLVMITASLSGCISDDSVDETLIEDDDMFRNYSVVAPVDTGINVYHDHFRTNETFPEWLLDGLGVTMTCDLTFSGTWQERYEADKETCWDNINSTDIVYFPGTKIIGTTPDDNTEIPILDDPSDGHGTAVTGAVLDANPDAIIFFVEGFSDAAVLAAANQPLVDIISTSFGPIGSIPVPGIEDATEIAVVQEKKIHTGAADNSPSPAVQDSPAGLHRQPHHCLHQHQCHPQGRAGQVLGRRYLAEEETAQKTSQGQEADEGHGQGGCAAGSLHGCVEVE